MKKKVFLLIANMIVILVLFLSLESTHHTIILWQFLITLSECIFGLILLTQVHNRLFSWFNAVLSGILLIHAAALLFLANYIVLSVCILILMTTFFASITHKAPKVTSQRATAEYDLNEDDSEDLEQIEDSQNVIDYSQLGKRKKPHSENELSATQAKKLILSAHASDKDDE
jgi:predicted membrane protein